VHSNKESQNDVQNENNIFSNIRGTKVKANQILEGKLSVKTEISSATMLSSERRNIPALGKEFDVSMKNKVVLN